jgi:hypothetical protein
MGQLLHAGWVRAASWCVLYAVAVAQQAAEVVGAIGDVITALLML